MTAKVSALQNASKTNKEPNSNKNISVAYQVMAIGARKKREEVLGYHEMQVHTNPQVFKLASLIFHLDDDKPGQNLIHIPIW